MTQYFFLVLVLLLLHIPIAKSFSASLTKSRLNRNFLAMSANLSNGNGNKNGSGNSKVREYLESSLEEVIADTDRGSSATKVQIQEANEIAKALIATSSIIDGKIVNNSDELYGNYDVSFVQTGDSQRGNPAGGGYRGLLGKFMFRTTGVYQNILKHPHESSPFVINFIIGWLFGIIPFSVVLKGIANPVEEKRRNEMAERTGIQLSPATVRVAFEPPLIAFGRGKSCIPVRVGPSSSVVLDTPYLSSKLRLGVGSRGSTFVFLKTNNPAADSWQDIIKRRAILSRPLGFILLSLSFSLAYASMRVNFMRIPKLLQHILRIFSRFVASLSSILAILLIFSKGGILE